MTETAVFSEDLIGHFPVQITVVLGEASVSVSELLKMGKGDVVQLNRLSGDPVEIWVNNRLAAYGELVTVEGRLGVTLSHKASLFQTFPTRT